MSRKLIIEIDDVEYSKLVDAYQEVKKSNPIYSDLKLEDFISDLLKSYIDIKAQVGSFGDNFKNILNELGGSSVDQMLSSIFNMYKNDKNKNSNNSKNTNDKSKDTDKNDDVDLLNKYKS